MLNARRRGPAYPVQFLLLRRADPPDAGSDQLAAVHDRSRQTRPGGLYQAYLDQIMQAYKGNRSLTGSIPACSHYLSPWSPLLDNPPADIVYTKPMIVLVDEFSISAADIFPSMIQDNGRAPLVGMRTSGGGGSVSGWPAGFYSEMMANNTNSLVLRKNPIATPDLPAAPYVENIGARPDIPLDYMTKDNLLQRGRPFVEAFTRIIVDRIKASR